MADISNERTAIDVWGHRIAYCCFGVVSTTLILTAISAAFLIMSGVLEW